MVLGNGRYPYSKSIDEELLSRRVILLDSPVDDAVAQEVIAKMLFLQSRSTQEPITLAINSSGGFVSSGMAIIDTIRELDPLVHTCCVEDAYALAAIILASGTRGGRSAARHARIGFRKTESFASNSELERKRIDEVLIQRTSEVTGISATALRVLFASGNDLSPLQALELGIIDRVVDQCIPALT
jgi:ATP-dependent Clp protease protease subunit